MPTQDNLDSSHLERHLVEAQTRAQNGDYDAAVKAVREAKSLAPKNVYVLAFERQAEQLNELHTANNLTEEQRTDILESIPSIIERALDSSLSPGMVTDLSALKSGVDASKEKKEKAAALEWLKNQYFQHAHEYIRKGEYQHALAEIRRVYIIDPGNTIARDFEKRFEELAQMKQGETPRPSAFFPPGVLPVPPLARPVTGAPPETDTLPMVTEEWSSPQQIDKAPARAARPPEKTKEKKKGSTILIVMIVIAVCVLAAMLYFYYQRNGHKKSPVTALPTPTTEQFIGAPSSADEQNFLVSNDDTSSGTPMVTELAVRGEPPPAESRVSRNTAKSSGIPGSREKKTAPRNSPPVQNTKQQSPPPLMATQAQPEQKEPPVQPKTEDTAQPAPFIAIEKEARIIRLERPRISGKNFLLGVKGQVVVQVRIDATGKPVQTVTLKSTNDLLVQPVIDAVMTSQYAPAEMTSGPVASWLTIPFKFETK